MQLRKGGTEQPAINLTSLIDVVFLLLIFFMITTTFQHSTALKVVLPEAETADEQDQPQTVVLAIDVDGRFAIDNEILDGNDKHTIQRALERRWADAEDASLIINADADVAHKHVVTALDAAAAAGITRLSIATEQDTEPAQGAELEAAAEDP